MNGEILAAGLAAAQHSTRAGALMMMLAALVAIGVTTSVKWRAVGACPPGFPALAGVVVFQF
jgi:hypothetical protein